MAGGTARDEVGFFVDPTVTKSRTRHRLMTEEIFGPIVAVFVYEDSRFGSARARGRLQQLCAHRCSVARDRRAVELALGKLRLRAALYLNDKPTGAVVGAAVRGGRLSGTTTRPARCSTWCADVAARDQGETRAAAEWRYPYMGDADGAQATR